MMITRQKEQNQKFIIVATVLLLLSREFPFGCMWVQPLLSHVVVVEWRHHRTAIGLLLLLLLVVLLLTLLHGNSAGCDGCARCCSVGYLYAAMDKFAVYVGIEYKVTIDFSDRQIFLLVILKAVRRRGPRGG